MSIVTPVYNGARFLAETMECVQAQTYPNVQHLVLDNASVDSTPEIIARFTSRRVPVRAARNNATLPIIESWNAAIRMIGPNTAYFRILPADDLIVPHGIEKMVDAGEQNPKVDIIGCQEWRGDAVLGTELPRDHTVFDGRCIARGSLLNAIHGFPHFHCLFRMPKEGLPQSFYDLRYHDEPLLALDMDAAIRALSKGPYAYIHEPLVTTRLHSDSITSTLFAPERMKMWSELQLIDKWRSVVFDSHADYMKCRQRHLRFYYRYLLLWLIRSQRELYQKHLDLLTKASAQPTPRDYVAATLQWPIARTARTLKRVAIRFGMPAYRFEYT